MSAPDSLPWYSTALLVKDDRQIAEDQYFVDAQHHIAMIVDGVSSQRGEEASQMAVDLLSMVIASLDSVLKNPPPSENHPPPHDTEKAFITASDLMHGINDCLYHENLRQAKETMDRGGVEPKSMLASAVIVRLYGNRLYYSHLGDSRLMIFRHGKLIPLTRDHSLLQEEIDSGFIPYSEKLQLESPLRHILTRCLGEWNDTVPEGVFDLQAGDIALLCSDGLTHSLSHSAIEEKYAQFSPLTYAEKANNFLSALLSDIKKRGADDDVSTIIIGR